MSCSRTIPRVAIGLLLLMAAGAFAQKASPKPVLTPEQSCRAYVQKFYGWYVPAMLHSGNKVMSDVALDRKDFAFSPELRKSLKEDLAASRKNKDEIVGLDFDPFLNTQDPEHRYVVGTVTVKDAHCSANVHGVVSGKKNEKSDVTPELELRDGRWTFINFHYGQTEKPEDENLLAVLKTLRDARKTSR